MPTRWALYSQAPRAPFQKWCVQARVPAPQGPSIGLGAQSLLSRDLAAVLCNFVLACTASNQRCGCNEKCVLTGNECNAGRRPAAAAVAAGDVAQRPRFPCACCAVSAAEALSVAQAAGRQAPQLPARVQPGFVWITLPNTPDHSSYKCSICKAASKACESCECYSGARAHGMRVTMQQASNEVSSICGASQRPAGAPSNVRAAVSCFRQTKWLC